MTSRLLVAHSDESLLSVYQSFFWDRDFEVEVAANVAECLATLPEFDPDVLILQQELRGGSGDLVISHLPDVHLSCIPPVLLLMGNEYISDLDIFVVPPVYACLRVPASLNSLLQVVKSAKSQRLRRELCPQSHELHPPLCAN